MKTKPNLTKLKLRQCPQTSSELKDAILTSGACNRNQSFERLNEAITLTPDFLTVTLPFVWKEALRAPEVLSDIQLLNTAGSISLTQRQCLCILSNAFLCTFTERPSDNCVSAPDLPSINFDELYSGQWESVEVAKLRMLFTYFEQMHQRHLHGDDLTRSINFIRRKVRASSAIDWYQCSAELIPPVMHGLRKPIDEAKGMLRVDFANSMIGGAAIAYGCVQEEIMFCECPELIVSRLFCPVMRPNEAIVIVGAEQFSQHTGYAESLEYGGAHTDSSPIHKSSYVVAIDALDLRYGDVDQQYNDELILSELTKAWAGFDVVNAPKNLATGNWGCGVFGGDAELKSVIQWLACSRAGKIMNYFPFDNEHVFNQFPKIAKTLISRCISVGEVARFLMQELQPHQVYQQLLHGL